MTPPFPLVVGCPRSGTTLVRSFLDSHPAMAIPGESDVTVRLLRGASGPGGRIPVATARDILRSSVRTAAWGVDLADVLAEVVGGSSPEPRSVEAATLVRAIYAAYARHAGRPRSGDKSPFHANHLPLLTTALPESVVVHVLRDPRSVTAAVRAVRWANGDAHAAGRMWRRHVANARASGAVLGADRYLEVRYEEVIDDPVPTLRRLCVLLDLDFDDAMVDRTESAARARAQTAHAEDHANLDRPLTVTRDWRAELGPVDVRRIEAVAGDLMISCGYPPVNDPISPTMGALRAIDAAGFSAGRWIGRRRGRDDRQVSESPRRPARRRR